MEPISRRRALQLGGLGLAAAAVGGVGLAWQGNRDTGSGATTATGWSEPATLASTGGELSLALEAAAGQFALAGARVRGFGFNGGVPGPTMRVRAGDRIRLRLRNRLPQPTNLHLHGMYLSPSGNGDNPFVRIEPGTDFDYEYRLPGDHPPGVYWYHPHHHGLVAEQIFGGLYGAIVVEDTDPVPLTQERVLVIADLTIDDSGSVAPASMMDRVLGREGNLVLVNGQNRPTVTARPGARERWRIVNACVSRSLRLRLDGQQMQLVGVDSGRFTQPHPVEEIVLAAGNRADLLVSTVGGSTPLRALPVDRGVMGMMGMMNGGGMGMPGMGGPQPAPDPAGVVVATLEVTGSPVTEMAPVPRQPVPRDLRNETVAAARTLNRPGMSGDCLKRSTRRVAELRSERSRPPPTRPAGRPRSTRRVGDD